MQDDGLDSEALDAWNNPHKYINNIECEPKKVQHIQYTPEELHAPLYTVLRKNIKTELETYDYKKYRIVKYCSRGLLNGVQVGVVRPREEKNNKTTYVIEEINLAHQPCWWRDVFGFSQLWRLKWSTYWCGYGSNKEPFTCLKDAEDYVNKLVDMLNKQQEDKAAPSRTIINIYP